MIKQQIELMEQNFMLRDTTPEDLMVLNPVFYDDSRHRDINPERCREMLLLGPKSFCVRSGGCFCLGNLNRLGAPSRKVVEGVDTTDGPNEHIACKNYPDNTMFQREFHLISGYEVRW